MTVRDTIARRLLRLAMASAEWRINRSTTVGRPLEASVSQSQPPVLLVHGFGNEPTSMHAIERSLRRDGFVVETIELPEYGCGDVHRDARLVLERVARIRAATGAAQVDVVGHSRGGLVSRTAQQLLDEDGSIGRVVTIASTNQGIRVGALGWIARLLVPSGVEQIRTLSVVSERLLATQDAFDLVSVGTIGHDGVVSPPSGMRIEGKPFLAVDEGRTIGPMSRIGHYRILRDDTSYEAIRSALLLPRR